MNQNVKNCVSCGRLLDEASLAKGRQQCSSCRRQLTAPSASSQPPGKGATPASSSRSTQTPTPTPSQTPKPTAGSVSRDRKTEPSAAPTNSTLASKNAPVQKTPDAATPSTRMAALDAPAKDSLGSQASLSRQSAKSNHPSNAVNEEPQATGQTTAAVDEVPPLHDLLPPKFLQPHLQQNGSALRSHLRHKDSVVLPTADGGTVTVNQHVRVIEHDGTTVRLQSLPDPVRQQRRQIVNLIVIVVALAILLVAFWWLAQDL